MAEALSKLEGVSGWDREPSPDEPSVSEVIREVLSRERQLAYIASLDDADLATT